MAQSTVVSSFFWKFLERSTAQLLNFAIQLVLARILMPEDFGSIAIITAIINYATIFVQSGLATVIVQRKDISKGDISTLLTSSLFIAFVLYWLLFFLSPYISNYYEMPDLVWPIRVMSLSLFLASFNSIQTAQYTREFRFKSLFYRSLIAIPISGFVGVYLALKGFGIWALVVQSLLNTIVVIIYMWFDKNIYVKFGFSLERAKSLYSFTWRILASGLLSSFSDTLRTMIIGKCYTRDNLAYYDKAYTYSGLLTQTIDTSIMGVLLPTFSRVQDDSDSLINKARKSVSMTAFIMFPLLLGACAMAKPLIILLLTEKWAGCIVFFMLFCIFRLPVSIVMIDKQVYLALGNSKIGLFWEIYLLVANVVMLLITMRISLIAIALGAIAVQYIGDIIVFVISSKIYGYKLLYRFLDIWKPLISAGAMSLVMFSLTKLELSNIYILLLQVLLGVSTFLLLEFILRDSNLKILSTMLNIRKK